MWISSFFLMGESLIAHRLLRATARALSSSIMRILHLVLDIKCSPHSFLHATGITPTCSTTGITCQAYRRCLLWPLGLSSHRFLLHESAKWALLTSCLYHLPQREK